MVRVLRPGSSTHGDAVGGSGQLYVTDILDHTIRKVTSAGDVTTFAGTPGSRGEKGRKGAAFTQPWAVSVRARWWGLRG